MCSMHNKEKSVISERIFRTLKNNVDKYKTTISKTGYIDNFNDINKYNNTYHRTIKMTPTDVNPSMCIDFNKENSKEARKFKVCDFVRISKYK